MSQGQLSGDRANMAATLKVIGPLLYGALYVKGKAAGLPQLPFLLNIALTLAALALTPIALRDATNADVTPNETSA